MLGPIRGSLSLSPASRTLFLTVLPDFYSYSFPMARRPLWLSLCCGSEEHWSGGWEGWGLFQTLRLLSSDLGQSDSFVWVLGFLLG